MTSRSALPLFPLLGLTVLLGLPAAVKAATPDPELPTLVVSATRLPETPGIDSSHVQVISQEDIRRSGARDLTTLLRQVAVVQLLDTVGDGSNGSIGMRGFGENGSQNSLLLLDGRRLNNDSDLAPPDLRNLSLDDIDHIEIINGSAGALFGSGAVGGIVNIVTKTIRRQVSAGYTGGSYDHEGYRLKAGEREGEMGVQVSAEKTTADNYRDRNELNRGFLQGKVTFDLDRFGFFVEASRHDLKQNFAGSLTPAQLEQNRRQAQYPGDFSDGQNNRYSVGTHVELAPDWLLTVDGNVRQDDAQGVLSNLSFTQSRDQHSVNPRINGRVKSGAQEVKIVGGYDYDSADYRFLSPFGPINNRQHVRGHYLQLGWSTDPAWELVAAGRHAELDSRIQDAFTYPTGKDIDDNVDVGSLAFYWRPANDLSSWLRADQNFRFAAADEQTMRPFGVFTPLHTQTGVSYETGVDYRADAWHGALQVYQLRLENEISYDPVQFANVNLDHTRRNGSNAQLDYRFGKQFLLGAQLALVDAKFTDGPADGKRVPFVARDHETLNLTWTSPWAVDVGVETQRLGSRYPSGDYTNSAAKLPPLYLSNLAVSYQWKGLQASARVNNLFDKRYNSYATQTFTGTAYVPAPERNLLVSVDYRFP